MAQRGLTASRLKEWARGHGADLVGVTSAAETTAHPPDPEWPQTPHRLWSGCRSVIALAKRTPRGLFLAQDLTARLSTPHLVMNSLDHLALQLSYYIESSGFSAFPGSPAAHRPEPEEGDLWSAVAETRGC